MEKVIDWPDQVGSGGVYQGNCPECGENVTCAETGWNVTTCSCGYTWSLNIQLIGEK